MTMTTPTGNLWVDLALFTGFFIYAGAVVVIGTALQTKRERNTK